MKFLVIFLSFLSLIIHTSFSLPRLGSAWKFSPRVIGGTETAKNEIPYQLSLRYFDDHICGAALISANYAITAAHCITSTYLKPYSIVAGDHDLTVVEADSSEQISNISQAFIHEEFDLTSYANDIALLKLVPAVTLNDKVQIIKIPLKGYKALGNGILSGWGAILQDGPKSPVLRKASVPIHADLTCQNLLGSKYLETMLCAGDLSGRVDYCSADGGGPLTIVLDNEPLLVGIASNRGGCGNSNTPGLYTEVAYFIDWIKARVPLL